MCSSDLHKAFDIAESGDVIVVDAGGDCTNSLVGELMLSHAKKRGIAGVVINGAVRDYGWIKSHDYPVFAAGVSRYGIGDLETLATDTHKFESRYPDALVGPYPAARDLYVERSPVHHVDRLSSPMLVLQGLDDKVVPPSQSEALVAALAAKGIPHAYVAYEGEGHGFRKAENIVRSLESELSFYAQVLGFPHPEGVPVLPLTTG